MVYVRKETNTENWDQELSRSGGSIFMSRDWLMALQDIMKTPIFLTFNNGNKRLGMIAGLERPVKDTNYRQLFFYSGIACGNPSSVLLNECKSALVKFAKDNGYVRIIMKSYDHLNNIQSSHKDFYAFRRGEYFIDLDRPLNEIENGFHKNARRLVKKVKAGGVIFKEGYSDTLLDKLFCLLNITHDIRSSKGYGSYEIFSMPFIDRMVMSKLLQSGMAAIFYAEYKSEIVSIQFTVRSDERGYALLMGTNEKGYSLGAPTMLWHEIVFHLKEKGLKSYNLGGLPTGKKNAGLDRFKRSLGAVPVKSSDEYTGFLDRPLSGLNLFITSKRAIIQIKLPWKLKRILLDILDLLIKGRDEY